MMKKIKSILFLGTLLFIIGCTDESQETFQEEQVEETEKRQLININGPGWTPCEAANLQIFIPECLNATNAPVWNAGILAAVNNYNSVAETGINIVVTTVAADADIVFQCFDDGGCFGGFVAESFVDTGMSGTIDLNTSLDLANCSCSPGGLDVCSATFVVMHEMAHALGFFHNNDSHPNAVLVDGTPDNNDPNSVINGGDIVDWCNMPCNFSNFDIVALQAIYPCNCPPSIEGDFDLCVEEETATYCIDQDHPVDVQWTSPVVSSSNCITFPVPSSATSILLAANIQDNGCEYEITESVEVHENEICTPPSQEPVDFSQICLGELTSVCYDFENWDCLEIIEIQSSSRKLVVDIDGTEVCLSYIWTKPTTIQLDVTFINWCGESESALWTIDIVNCEDPVIVNPPTGDDPPHGGPTADDCSDFDNPCPCDTAADCPPGWKCIGGGSNKFCIEI